MPSRLGFLFEARQWGEEAIGKAWEIIKSGISEGMKSPGIIDQLRDAGLGYRRQDMLSDIRRMGAVAHIGVEAGVSADRAMKIYDAYIEPYRKASGLTAREAWQNYNVWKKREENAAIELDELEEGAEYFAFGEVSPSAQ